MSSKGQLTTYIRDLKRTIKEKDKELHIKTKELIMALDERDNLKNELKTLKKKLKPKWHVRKLTQLKRFVAERSET